MSKTNGLKKLSALGVMGVGGILLNEQLSYKIAEKKLKTKEENLQNKKLTYTFKDNTIAYYKIGSDKPALLLIHDFYIGASNKEWYKVQEQLSKHYTVYSVDCIGYGNSSKPTKSLITYEQSLLISNFIKNIILTNTTEKVTILGSNGGGDVALTIAHLNKELVEKLILISPTGFFKGYPTSKQVNNMKKQLLPIVSSVKTIKNTKSIEVLQQLSNKFSNQENIDKEFLETCQIYSRIGGKNNRYIVASQNTDFWHSNTLKFFLNSNLPITIFWGENNNLNPLSNFEKIFTEVSPTKPNVKFISFESTGYFPHIENPTGFINSIVDFI